MPTNLNIPAESTTMVVARFKEDLEWLTEVPGHFQITILNKGGFIESEGALKRANHIIECENNLGREADTYLKYLSDPDVTLSDWTVFTQGNPFSHSPDFLDLLHSQHLWRDLQPLTWRWLEERFIPPPEILDSEREAWIGNLRVRKEFYSLHTWNPLDFDDGGAMSIRGAYAAQQGLAEGGNVASHFFGSAELHDLAAQAELAHFGRFNYGAIFAVRRSLIERLPRESYARLLKISSSHHTHPYLLERLWLHLFGEPFLQMSVLADSDDRSFATESPSLIA